MATEPAPNPETDLSQIPIKSPLVDPVFRYYTTRVESPVTLNLGAAEVIAEFKRVHDEARAAVTRVERNPADPMPGKEEWTWGSSLRYRVFHTAYHCGQAFSVRHLMGHTTTDN